MLWAALRIYAKSLVGSFNKERALVGTFYEHCENFEKVRWQLQFPVSVTPVSRQPTVSSSSPVSRLHWSDAPHCCSSRDTADPCCRIVDCYHCCLMSACCSVRSDPLCLQLRLRGSVLLLCGCVTRAASVWRICDQAKQAAILSRYFLKLSKRPTQYCLFDDYKRCVTSNLSIISPKIVLLTVKNIQKNQNE